METNETIHDGVMKDVDGQLNPVPPKQNSVQPSVAEVYFYEEDVSLPYYTDRFNLEEGDTVFVEGKMAGKRGQVQKVSHTFRIRSGEYEQIRCVVAFNKPSKLYFSTSHLIEFRARALSIKQVKSWFGVPEEKGDLLIGEGTETFRISDPFTTGVNYEFGMKAHNEYFRKNKVKYLSLENGNGYAIVVDDQPYEVRFRMDKNGTGRALTCTCREVGVCVHSQAAVFELWELMDAIMEKYRYEYLRFNRFYAVSKDFILPLLMNAKQSGSITID